jgi:hypothetical protein
MNEEALRKQNSFGRDFLTWLAFASDERAGKLELATGETFSLWIDGKIVMEDDRPAPPNCVSYSGDDFTNQDIKAANRAGKKVREMRLRIERGENTWTFTLRGDRMELSGLKIDMPKAADKDELFFGRIMCIESLNKLLDGLYAEFIMSVHGSDWKAKGYRRFQKWLKTA